MYKINLLPQELLADTDATTPKSPVVEIVIFLGILAVIYVALSAYIFVCRSQINQKRMALKDLEPQIQRVEALQSKTAILKARLDVLHRTVSEQRQYYPVFKDINANLPEDMWLTRVSISLPEASDKSSEKLQVLNLQEPTQVLIEGGTNSLASVGVYVNKLAKLGYFKQVVLKEVKEVELADGWGVTVFTIEARLVEGGWR